MTITELKTPGASLELAVIKCPLPTQVGDQWYEAPATRAQAGQIWLMFSRCNTGPNYQLMLAYCDVDADVINGAPWKDYSTDPVITGNGGDDTGPGLNCWYLRLVFTICI